MKKLVLILLLSGCVSSVVQPINDTGDGRLERDRRELEELLVQMDGAIGEAAAEDIIQCRSIAFGTMACGGTSTTRVFSVTEGDSTRILALADRYTLLENAMNRRHDVTSGCIFFDPPPIALRDGRCVADDQ